MVRYVYASPGVPEQVQQVFPVQPKCHEDGSEWGEIFHRKLVEYLYQISFIDYWVEKEEISIVNCLTHFMLAYYFTKPLQGALFDKFRDVIMGRVSPLTLLEDTFSYTGKESVGKQIPSKEIPSGTGDPLKETKKMLEAKNDKHIQTIIGGTFKNNEILRDKNDKQVRTSTGGPL